VTHFALAKPKIGLYTGGPIEPPNPHPLDATTQKDYCSVSVALASTYCEALFTLREKDRIPAGVLDAITDADVPALAATGITALIDPNLNMPSAPGLQAFVNTGGRFVGTGSGGTTSARAGGLTNVNTTSLSGTFHTPGSTFQGTFDTSSPLVWGFDLGGWIYRDTDGNPIYDPSTLGTAKAAVTYTPGVPSYGHQVGASGPGRLDGRPAVIDQALGSGRVTLIGFNPFFRAWHEASERIALNAALYPTGSQLPAGPPTASRARAAELRPAHRPLAKRRLPKRHRHTTVIRTERDIRIAVWKFDGRALRRAALAAHLPTRIAKHLGFIHGRRTVTLVIRGVRGDDFERRAGWIGPLKDAIERRGIRPLYAQI
jgi:hypothetical protein